MLKLILSLFQKSKPDYFLEMIKACGIKPTKEGLNALAIIKFTNGTDFEKFVYFLTATLAQNVLTNQSDLQILLRIRIIAVNTMQHIASMVELGAYDCHLAINDYTALDKISEPSPEQLEWCRVIASFTNDEVLNKIVNENSKFGVINI